MMNKTILYVSGAMTAAHESFVKDKGAEIRNQFVSLEKEKDYDHVFVRKEVPGFRGCENAKLFESPKLQGEVPVVPDVGEKTEGEEVTTPVKSTKKKTTKKVVKD